MSLPDDYFMDTDTPMLEYLEKQYMANTFHTVKPNICWGTIWDLSLTSIKRGITQPALSFIFLNQNE